MCGLCRVGLSVGRWMIGCVGGWLMDDWLGGCVQVWMRDW